MGKRIHEPAEFSSETSVLSRKVVGWELLNDLLLPYLEDT